MFAVNYTQAARLNTNFRQVLHTGQHGQVVAMSLLAGSDIGEETHDTIDQIFIFVSGGATVLVEHETRSVGEGDMLFVPAGSLHNIINTGSNDLKLITIYCPPAHADGTVHATKADAVAAEAGEENTPDIEPGVTLPDTEATL